MLVSAKQIQADGIKSYTTDELLEYYDSHSEEAKKELVNHPDYYNWIKSVECIDVVEHFNFNLGNAIKYIWRCGRKNPDKIKEDLNKAIWYIQRELAKIEDEENSTGS